MRFIATNLIQAIFTDARLNAADFTDSGLVQANLNGAVLPGAQFLRARLRYAQCIYLRACGADFTDADLFGANLHAAELDNCQWKGARLDDIRPTDPLRLAADRWQPTL